MQGMSGNVIREILKVTQQPDIISLAGGLPSPESFPIDEMRRISEQVFSGGAAFLQYGLTEGLPALRARLAAWVGEVGLKAQPENVLLTSGSQQGIDLIAKALLDP